MTTLIKIISCPRLNEDLEINEFAIYGRPNPSVSASSGRKEVFIEFVERKECECESGNYFPRAIMCDEYNSETKKCNKNKGNCIYSKWKKF